MKLPSSIRLDWNHILQDLIVVGITLGTLGFITFSYGEDILKQTGEFAYNGLPPEQIRKVYALFREKFEPFSEVGGYQGKKYFRRGIHLSKSGNPYYFHYEEEPDGDVEFEMYPMVYEAWTTDRGLFDYGAYKTGSPIYP